MCTDVDGAVEFGEVADAVVDGWHIRRLPVPVADGKTVGRELLGTDSYPIPSSSRVQNSSPYSKSHESPQQAQ